MQDGIIMDRKPGRTHVALLSKGRATEMFCEPDERRGALGNIFMGRVVRVLPGMQAAFVDIALKRTAFLYVADLLPVSATGGPTPHKAQLPSIDTLVRAGAPVLVQVRKEAMADKGPRVTTHITLTGRYLVLMPNAHHVAISQRITEGAVRDALMARMEPLVAGLGGVVVRTAALEAPPGALEDELARLAARWRAISEQAKASSKPRVLWNEPAAAVRAVRELYQPAMDGILINDGALVDAVALEVSAIYPHRAHTVSLWQPAPKGMGGLVQGDVWRAHKLHETRAQALHQRITLPGGGYLVLQQTEALTVVDVNSGTYVGQKTLEKTMVALNVVAAEAIARALRLRNIGGIVVIDFVDVETAAGSQAVVSALTQAMAQDRAKHHILPMNKFGLVALTRRRLRPSIRDGALSPCPYCKAEGAVATSQEVGEAAVAAVYAWLARSQDKGLLLQSHPEVVHYLEGEGAQALEQLQRAMDTQVLLVARSGMHRARFEIMSLDEPGRVESADLRP